MDHLAPGLDDAVARWDRLGLPRPDAMVVAGSGLSTGLGTTTHGPRPWDELIPFPIEGIEGHPLAIELLQPCPGRVVLYARGRLHAYQGYTSAEIVFPVRLAARLGARVLLMTNSAGGLDPDQRPGDLMVIRDHLNLSGRNPLLGRFPATWGPQFPDMSSAYDPALRSLLHGIGQQQGLGLKEGVYACVLGPSYETPAEVVMLRRLGADAVGMSTAQEIIAGHHMGMRCAAVSLISNPAAGVSEEPLDHQDVLAVGKQAGDTVARLLGAALAHPDLFAS